MILIDTHAHLNFNAYKDDVDDVIRRSFKNNVYMINVGSQYLTSRKAAELVGKYEKGIYAAIGLHPIHASEPSEGVRRGHSSLRTEEEFDYEKYRQLARLPGVVAIGETGLDYKEEYFSFQKKQKQVFLRQLELAREMNLPVIFHCRKAHADLIETINSNCGHAEKLPRGVIHCFSGNWKEGEKYLEMGFYLGFNGIIFKLNLDETIKKTPLDKILIETDCPYLTPLPAIALAKAGAINRNEPIYVKYVAERIAEIKKITFEEVAGITTENAKLLFNL